MGLSDHASATTRAPYAQPRLLALVALGGAVGATARWQVSEALPWTPGDWPWATFAVNILGSLLLGLLLETLLRAGPDAGWRRGVRVGVGTGLLGGFTTYSSFMVETSRLLTNGDLALGIGYAAVSVAVGFLAAVAGVAVARMFRLSTSTTGSTR